MYSSSILSPQPSRFGPSGSPYTEPVTSSASPCCENENIIGSDLTKVQYYDLALSLFHAIILKKINNSFFKIKIKHISDLIQNSHLPIQLLIIQIQNEIENDEYLETELTLHETIFFQLLSNKIGDDKSLYSFFIFVWFLARKELGNVHAHLEANLRIILTNEIFHGPIILWNVYLSLLQNNFEDLTNSLNKNVEAISNSVGSIELALLIYKYSIKKEINNLQLNKLNFMRKNTKSGPFTQEEYHAKTVQKIKDSSMHDVEYVKSLQNGFAFFILNLGNRLLLDHPDIAYTVYSSAFIYPENSFREPLENNKMLALSYSAKKRNNPHNFVTQNISFPQSSLQILNYAFLQLQNNNPQEALRIYSSYQTQFIEKSHQVSIENKDNTIEHAIIVIYLNNMFITLLSLNMSYSKKNIENFIDLIIKLPDSELKTNCLLNAIILGFSLKFEMGIYLFYLSYIKENYKKENQLYDQVSKFIKCPIAKYLQLNYTFIHRADLLLNIYFPYSLIKLNINYPQEKED